MSTLARCSVAAALMLSVVLAGCANTTPAPIVQKPALPARAPATVTAPAVRRTAPAIVPAVHRVVGGDTLHAIAFRYGLDHRDLIRWNHLSNPNLIFVGQTLRLRPPPAQAAAKPPAAARTTPPPTPAMARAPGARVPPTAASTGAIRWQWPAQGKATIAVSLSGAKGLDIRGSRGQPVKAAADGAVVYSGSGLRGYGELIILKHNDTFLSAYAHNESRLVQEGSRVGAGEAIARMGNTDSKEVMLHFEIRRNGKAVDPLQYLPSR